MRHDIQHTLITLVAYTCYYWQRELRTVVGQVIRIEAREFARGTTATYNHHHIPAVNALGNAVERGYYALLYTIALHGRLKKTGIENEAVPVSGKLVAEIAITGSRCRRYHSYLLRQQREWQLLVETYHALIGKALYHHHALARHVADCIRRLNITHVERIAVQFMKAHRHLQQHLQARCERLPRLLQEVWAQQRIYTRPHGTPGLGHKLLCHIIALHKLYVTMSRTRLTHLTELASHPIARRQPLAHGATHHIVERV